MKAQIIRQSGSPEVFEFVELDDPVPGPGQILVRQHATSINPVDTKIRGLGLEIGPTLPGVLGCDIAGTIESVGAETQEFAVGDEVFGCGGGVRGMGGAYAEKIVTDPALLCKKPAGLSFLQAAALPLVTITAWEGLFERANLASGQHVLIHGGTGGVGHIALQIAKAAGARVSVTVSKTKTELAKDLGADDTIDYRAEEVGDYVQKLTGGKGFDVVFDTTGANLPVSFEAAKLNGQVVTTVSRYEADLSPMHGKGLSLHVVFMLIPMLYNIGRRRHGEILRDASAMVEKGKLRPLIDDQAFTLETIGNAHRHLESGQARGKVVVTI